MGKPKRNYQSDPNVSSEKDRCGTPPYAMLPLYPYLDALAARCGHPLNVWEAAAGDGRMVGYLHGRGYTVVAGDLLTGQNYFDEQAPPLDMDVHVTNPPYGARVKYRWIKTAYARQKPFALLMPFETWAAKQAQTLFEQHGVEVILFDDRIDYFMPNKGYTSGGSNFPSAWFTWGLGIGQPVTYGKIGKAKKEFEREMARLTYEKTQPRLFAWEEAHVFTATLTA